MDNKELLFLEYKNKSNLRCYISFYSKYKFQIFLSVILFWIKNSPIWIIPIITANIINALTESNSDILRNIIIQFTIGAILIIQNCPSHILYMYVFSLVSRRVEMDLRLALCTRLQHLSIPYHTNTKMGKIQNKVLRDVENIENMTRIVSDIIPTVFIVLVITIVMTGIRAPKFLLFYIVIIPIAILSCLYFTKKMRQTNQMFRLSMESMSGSVIEMLRLITVTRAHNVEADELNKVRVKLSEVKDSGLKLDKLNSIFGSVNWVILQLFSLITVFVAAILSHKKIIDVGIGDIFLLSSFFNSLSGTFLNLIGLTPHIARGFESVRSISEILECPDIEKNEGQNQLNNLNGEIEFKSVSYAYDQGDKLAIDNFSLKIKKGETIAFVGPSGSGKSTIMQLLIGFIRPSSGELLFDGQDVNKIDMRTYRKFISVVSQESILFDGTILENITYGATSATQEDINNAIKAANLEEFINTLPEGINTKIKEGGARLSGGQRQRLSIARALLRNPRILLLDEATSALDVEAERQIQSALDRLIEGRTTFIVAHRLSTIRNADKIIVLDNGKIVEFGSHRDLKAKKGIYNKMLNLQAVDIIEQ